MAAIGTESAFPGEYLEWTNNEFQRVPTCGISTHLYVMCSVVHGLLSAGKDHGVSGIDGVISTASNITDKILQNEGDYSEKCFLKSRMK